MHVCGEEVKKQKARADSLFTNIVYRLDYPVGKRSTVRKRMYWLMAFSLVILPLLSLIIDMSTGSRYLLRSTSAHVLFEFFFLILSLLIAYAIWHEYSVSGKQSIFYLSLAFLFLGLNDYLQAFFGKATVLLSLNLFFSVFSGAVFFFLSALSLEKDTWAPPRSSRRIAFFILPVAIFAVVTLILLLHPAVNTTGIATLHSATFILPEESTQSDLFLMSHIITAIVFLLPGFLFLKYFSETDDLIYYMFSLCAFLFFESELFFALYTTWSPGWWCAHITKLFMYLGLGVGIVHALRRVFYEMRASSEKYKNLAHEVTRAYEDLRDTQEKLIETEKMASIGRLAAVISHEIKNPLGAIRNSVGVFRDRMRCSSDNTELFEIIEKEINRLNKMTTDFLEFARPAPLNKSKTNLHRLIEEALSLLFPGGKAGFVDVQTEFDLSMPEFFFDGNAMKQVLWNILTNALQAMTGGGTITLKTAYTATIRNDRQYREVSISISDTGLGMPAETLEKAFQPFFSTKAKGSGLGMSIVQRIIRQHGGNVSISSVPQEGTTVTINLPVE